MSPFFRRLLRRPVAIACCAYLAVLVGVAIVAPIAMPSVDSQNAGDLFGANRLPSWSHLLGTDTLGRDVLSRLLVVMYAGQIVERSDVQSIFDTPLHPYTEALLASNPHLAPEAATLPMIPGTVPTAGSWPAGCRFSARCRYAVAACAEINVAIDTLHQAHETRCIRYDQLIQT